MNYQVLRDFSGHRQGVVLSDADFIHARRARQLVEMRFLSVVPDSDDVTAITGGTVAQMRQMISETTDTEKLEQVLDQEQRASAKRLIKRRLEELRQYA